MVINKAFKVTADSIGVMDRELIVNKHMEVAIINVTYIIEFLDHINHLEDSSVMVGIAALDFYLQITILEASFHQTLGIDHEQTFVYLYS